MNLKLIKLFLILFFVTYNYSTICRATNFPIQNTSKITYNQKNKTITLGWSEFGESGDYTISRGGSRLANNFIKIGKTRKLTFKDKKPNQTKYENY
jgi:hypothetical protein